MKRRHWILVWIVCFTLVGMQFDLIKYCLDNNVLNKWYFFIIGYTLFVSGCLCQWLESKMNTDKNTKKHVKKKV